jgi:hypothetical protein
MGIEPTGVALPELENKRFVAMADAKFSRRSLSGRGRVKTLF